MIDQNVGVFMAWRLDDSGLVLAELGRGEFVVEMSSGQSTALSGFEGVIAGAVLLR